ncbi:hypothetical protein AVEN_16668-1 [Araneus ventricosus]|uniref:C2H2-type domain-containing protein n=1 Tax=Araneus ventricosus TaxID=182803 RepID=A0A4Y2U494_ARAVE|nr:hypothetical protein AVEN_16668-1 [Araneus ventricosus]
MIVYRCVCGFKKYFSTEVLICPVCGGSEFVKLTFNMAHPESALPPLPQPTNSSRKSTNPIGEVKIRAIGNSPCQREEVASAKEDFIFPFEDTAENVINEKKFRDTNQKGRNSSDLLNKRGNSPNENLLPEDSERENEVSKQNARTSQQQKRIEGGVNYRRNRAPTSKKGFKCWKCRKGFANESELKIYLQNPCEPINRKPNLCEPNQHKCWGCSEEFLHDWKLKEHLVVHSEASISPGIQNTWCQTQTLHVQDKEAETPSYFNYLADSFSASPAKPHHLMNFNHQSSKHERENQSSLEKMLEKQITAESSQIENEDSQIDLDTSSLISLERCTSHFVTENVIDRNKFIDTNEKGGNTSDLLNKRGNSSTENSFPENLESEEVSKQKASTSQQQTRTEGVENFRRKRAPTSKKGFKCWKCRRGFTNESELNIHMQKSCELNFGKPNHYKCGECSKEFSHEWKLKAHLVVHWEVKPFECEHCDLAFKREKNLTSHMKKYHESEMETYFSKQEPKNEFKCGKCSKKFTSESELIDHLQQNSCDLNSCK